MTFEEITSCLSPEDQKIVRDIILLYQDIDRQTSNFAAQTGLCCKAGCGACCENPQVETTVAEVLPLAVYLWSRGDAQSKLEAIQSNERGRTCIFYRRNLAVGEKGHCSIYPYRPGLCRLFGFSARRDKHGTPQLITCKIIKANFATLKLYQKGEDSLPAQKQKDFPMLQASQPQACAHAQQQLLEGQTVLTGSRSLSQTTCGAPLLSVHALRVFNIDPASGQKLLPINQAIERALEKVGLKLHFP